MLPVAGIQAQNYNRWFTFQASATGDITITVLRGGGYGSIRGVNLALWESDGVTEIESNVADVCTDTNRSSYDTPPFISFPRTEMV